MEFPYKINFIKESSQTLFEKLLNNSLVNVDENKIIIDPKAYDINIITDLYTENVRMKANIYNLLSPIKYWEMFESKIREKSIETFGDQETFSLRETMYMECKEATSFSVVLAKYIFDTLLTTENSIVVDPFSGWGDRAIGALASNKIFKYYGIDCNKDLLTGYSNIKKDLDKDDKLAFYIQKFEDFKFPENSADLIFTSPPYFDFEIYSYDKNQSIFNKKSYNQWFEEWVKLILLKCIKICKKGGLLAFHIGSSFRTKTFSQDVLNYMTSYKNIKFVKTLDCFSNDKKRAIPIWIYLKE